MALFRVTVTKRDNLDYAKELLLNTERLGNFWESSEGVTKFEYHDTYSRRTDKVTYECNLTGEQLHALARESESVYNIQNERWLYSHVLEIRDGSGTKTFDQDMRIDSKRIKHGYDLSDKTHSYLFMDDDSFREVRYKVAHTIASIDAAGSQSTSLSFS
ncbi:hypothetical protein GF395_04380 [Candidatus Uhrbacteria bacterium]|nr:hypothetical protein [Candidatus Uhrbacteria bacterium]